MAEELGVDIDCRNDLPPTFSLAVGLDNLANAIARGLITPAGYLADIDPEAADWGYDIRGKINSRGTTKELQDVVANAQAQILRDPRVQGVEVTNIFDRTSSTGTLKAVLETAEGPFELILKVSDVDVKVLGAGAGASAQESASVAPSQTVAAAPTQIVLIPGPQGPPGPPGGGAGGGGGGVLDDGGEYSHDSTTQKVAWQETFDFGPATNVAVEFTAMVRADAGLGGPDFRLWIGGTDDTDDGTMVATFFANDGSSYEKKTASGTFACPGGLLLVKATMVVSSEVPGNSAWMKGISVKIS